MIEGLEHVLEGSQQPGLPELRCLLAELFGGCDANGWLVEQQALRRKLRVCRLRFVINGEPRAVIVKSLKPEVAWRTELVASRWLPAAGLADRGPALLGSRTDRTGKFVWHVYDDLGNHELDGRQVEPERVRAATELIACLHTRFAAHPLLGEMRLKGIYSGVHFYESSVNDALHALRAWRPSVPQRELHGRLLDRLYRLRDDLPRRAQVLAEWGGPETLLHGDLWLMNMFVIPTANGPHARLIDWDDVGVGPVSSDLSRFLLQFPPQDRSWVLENYREATARAGWSLPPAEELNFLCETFEYARWAREVIWPSIAIVIDKADWEFDNLTEVDRWFDGLQRVLPVVTASCPSGPAVSNPTPPESLAPIGDLDR
jgi:phosphotransferase family enzyme